MIDAANLRNLFKYCPHTPTPRQLDFLARDDLEAFYGGAAGGGKSDALLMAALQYAHVPGYSALILRRDFARLSLPSAIMDRARQWFYETDAVWNGNDKKFRFPSGATIQFGYIDNPDDRFRYASSEFQYIAYDELTEFRLGEDESNPYEFLFSRLRKTTDMVKHDVPLRVRAASNPGNIGHMWVLNRFVSDEAISALAESSGGIFRKANKDGYAVFVPASIDDNPHLDREEYINSLQHLPEVTRQRLLNGDWSVLESALINRDWLRYYQMRGGDPTRHWQGGIIQPLDVHGQVIGPPRNPAEIHDVECQRIFTVDTAGTSKDKAKESKGRNHSWSVCAVWDYWPKLNHLFLRHVWRDRVDWIGLKDSILRECEFWRPSKVAVEFNNHNLGGALIQELQSRGWPTEGMAPNTDKVTRATALLKRLERGELFLPQYNNSWLDTLLREWLSWTGDEEQTDDQVDVASYAANLVEGMGGSGGISSPFWGPGPKDNWSMGRVG